MKGKVVEEKQEKVSKGFKEAKLTMKEFKDNLFANLL